jgi:hypothetical protein
MKKKIAALSVIVEAQEKTFYEEGADRIGLTLAELFRRALRLGVPQVLEANYPGLREKSAEDEPR